MQSEKVRVAHSRLAVASRKDRGTSPAELAELKRDYTAAKIADYVEREVRKAPPLTAEQMAIISRAMRGQTTN